ncbi:MAG: hypothetical protein ABL860_01560 [Candidatus Nitrotoga sp.]
MDIVDYSKKTVLEQIGLKEGFNTFLLAAIDTIPADDRIVLDTTDGAVVSFLGDIDAALKVALGMRKILLTSGLRRNPPLLVRLGINLGPVRLVRDANGSPNIVGDGINVAQRVMNFADPDQILVSRSYFEAVSRVSKSYDSMFHYQGSRTDKHVREHDVYAIGNSGDAAVRRGVSHAPTVTQPGLGAQVTRIYLAAASALYSMEQAARASYIAASPQRRMLYTGWIAVLLGLVLAILIALISNAAKPSVESPAALVANNNKEPAVGAITSVPVSSVVTVTQPVQEKIIRQKKKIEPLQKELARTRSLEETTAINSGRPALISLSVLPWGEVYLDGRMQGVSPPLAEMHVVPGKHEIEVRNSTFPAYRKVFLVKPGGVLRIQHKFGD